MVVFVVAVVSGGLRVVGGLRTGRGGAAASVFPASNYCKVLKLGSC